MQKGEIYLAKLPRNGHLQSGTRPVIIIQNTKINKRAPTVIVCGITSKNKTNPAHMYIGKSGGLDYQSYVLCEQIFTINKKDLIKKIGLLSNDHLLNILDKKICKCLGIGAKNEETQ